MAALETLINDVTYNALELELQAIRDRNKNIDEYTRRIHEVVENNRSPQLLKTMPGVGNLIDCAMAVALSDPNVFKLERNLAVFLGLVPGHTSGDKTIMLDITKRGDQSGHYQ